MDYYSGYDIGTGFDPYHQIVGWGSGEAQNSSVQQVQAATNMFRQMFKNLTGQDPNADQIGQFQTQALTGAINAPGDLGYGDSSNLINNWIQNTQSPLISQYQQQQQQNQLQKTQQSVQDLINKQMQATTADLTNPQSPTYQQFAGLMNNMGITPSSGAFQAGLGGQIGQNASNAINAALGGVSLPALAGIQGMTGYPMQVSSQFNDLSHLNQLSDFGLQSELAKYLSDQSQPSAFAKDFGYATSGLTAGGNALLGAGTAKKSGLTWVCTQLRKEGLLSYDEVGALHDHLYRAFWKRPLKFIQYLLFGKLLVFLANKVGTYWPIWKCEFYDVPMAEKDPVKAVDLYEQAFWNLFRIVKFRLREKSMLVCHHGTR